MERLFENLYLYEVVLLFLGVFLFIILCAGLVYYIIKKDDIKKLLFFFPIPILMIGYPSIQEIQIEKDKIALIKYTDDVLANPEDKIAKEELSKVTEKLEKRAHSIKDLKAVSEANLVLGNADKVLDLTQQAFDKQGSETDVISVAKNQTSSSSEVDRKREAMLTSLKGIHELATVQKTVQEHPEVFKDTLLVQQKISKVSWSNPRVKQYLNKKILNTDIKE